MQRKTILPAPPLPTAAAHRSSHLDTLRAANDKLSNLRMIHSSSPEENIIAENHEMETTIPTSSSVVYDSFVAEESTLSSTLKTFLLEIEELEDRLEKQLEIKQSLLVKAHKEHEQAVDGDNTVNHRKYFRHSELRNPSEAFRLDFEVGHGQSLVSHVLMNVNVIDARHGHIAYCLVSKEADSKFCRDCELDKGRN